MSHATVLRNSLFWSAKRVISQHGKILGYLLVHSVILPFLTSVSQTYNKNLFFNAHGNFIFIFMLKPLTSHRSAVNFIGSVFKVFHSKQILRSAKVNTYAFNILNTRVKSLTGFSTVPLIS